VRYESHRFDDDLNRLKLGSFWVADFAAFRTLANRWEVFFAVENLFNRRYAVQASPVELQGTPRLVSAGLRFRLMGK
jgi:outer membrane receptor protein involved in Fe transport